MKVMIVGAAGFLGSNAAAYFLQSTDFAVVSIDDLSGTPDVFNLEPVLKSRNRHNFYIADVYDHRIMNTILKVEKPDAILFVAKSARKSDREMAFSALLATLYEGQHKLKKILYVHSGMDQEAPPEFNTWPLEISKKIITLNICRIFGIRQYPTKFIPRIISSLLSNTACEEPKSEEVFEWMYIRDFLTALVAVLYHGNAPSYNIFSGICATEKEIISTIALAMGRDQPFEVENATILSNTVDASDLFDLNWQPKYKLDEALEHTASWYSTNTWALRNGE